MTRETGAQGARPETTIAHQRSSQDSAGARHSLARARASALCVVTSATAAGVLEPTEAVLSATAELASSLAWDLWVDGLAS